MNLDLTQYQTFVFDCDGVVLNSNKVKTQAFYDATLSFGHEAAQTLVDYHVQNGGISRYLKFEYFIAEILKQPITQDLLDDLLNRFASEVKVGLTDCQIAPGLVELREKTSLANWLIVSGGDQDELREVFAERGLFDLFNGGIFGSPDNKDVILKREMDSLNIHVRALFLGDSKYDYEAASRANLDFIFLSNWSEVTDWQSYTKQNDILALDAGKSLL
jgi:HAD superfamily hydrolase (TIGR01549 family)